MAEQNDFPDGLFEPVRKRAKPNPPASAPLETKIATALELARRGLFIEKALRMQARRPLTAGPFPSTEETIREDRSR